MTSLSTPLGPDTIANVIQVKTHIHTHIYAHTHIHIHTYTYTPTHTHTHTLLFEHVNSCFIRDTEQDTSLHVLMAAAEMYTCNLGRDILNIGAYIP